jgi:hypothetical protein
VPTAFVVVPEIVKRSLENRYENGDYSVSVREMLDRMDKEP